MAVMKPDIVFFGEGLSPEFHQAMARDKAECDLLIVMGSSLKVRPVALIPSECFPLPRTALCAHCREVDPEVATATVTFPQIWLCFPGFALATARASYVDPPCTLDSVENLV